MTAKPPLPRILSQDGAEPGNNARDAAALATAKALSATAKRDRAEAKAAYASRAERGRAGGGAGGAAGGAADGAAGDGALHAHHLGLSAADAQSANLAHELVQAEAAIAELADGKGALQRKLAAAQPSPGMGAPLLELSPREEASIRERVCAMDVEQVALAGDRAAAVEQLQQLQRQQLRAASATRSREPGPEPELEPEPEQLVAGSKTGGGEAVEPAEAYDQRLRLRHLGCVEQPRFGGAVALGAGPRHK